MIRQTVLPFKLEITEQEITAKSGLTLLAEYHKSLNISTLIDRNLPSGKSNRGFKASVFANSIIGLIQSGGRSLESLRELRYETGIMKLIGQDLPDADSVGDWLRRLGQAGVEGMQAVNKELVKRLMRRESAKEYTLDMDATEIIADKYESGITYTKNKGYMPILGTLAQNKICVHHEFRNGNVSPHYGQKEFYEACQKNMPEGKRISHVRVDGAGYQEEFIEQLYKDKVKFAIRSKMSKQLRARIKGFGEQHWQSVKVKDSVCELISLDHAFTDKDSKRIMRMVVKRDKVRVPELFDQETYEYWAIVTNIEEKEMSDAEVLEWYNQRAESENVNKEVKIGFGMERMPCGQIRANALFFSLGILAYNLFIGFKKLVCPESWQKHTIATFRWKVINIAGQIIRHGRQTILRIKAGKELLQTFETIRSKIFAIKERYAY